MSKTLKALKLGSSVLKSKFQETPVQINVMPSLYCNLSCHYCSQYTKKTDGMPFEEFERIVKKADELGAGYFTFTGGEPTEWSHLVESIGLLTENNFASHLTTNGSTLDDKLAEELGKNEVDVLNVSLDSVDNVNGYDKVLAKHDTGFTDRLKHLRSEYNVLIKLNAVITEETMPGISKIIQYAGKNGFLLSIGLEVPNLRIPNPKPHIHILTPDLKHEIELAYTDGLLVEPPEYFENPEFDCFVGKQRSISIGPDGNIQFCYKTRIPSGHRFSEFRRADYETYLPDLRKHIDHCNPNCYSNCSYNAEHLKGNAGHVIIMLKNIITKNGKTEV